MLFRSDIILGVEDGGTVCGVAKNDVENIMADIVRTATNPSLLAPPAILTPELFHAGKKTLIRINIRKSDVTHSYKGVVYKREGDADVK